MSTRLFKITATTEFDVELEQDVIDAVTDEWRSSLYDLWTVEQIVEHVGLNLKEGVSLSSLDGWADQPDSNAKVVRDFGYVDVDVMEIF